MNLENLETIPNSELKLFLKNNNVSKYSKLKRKDLIKKVKGVLKRIQKGGVTDPLNPLNNINTSTSTSNSNSNPNSNPISTSTSNPTSEPPITDENPAIIKSSASNMFYQCCIS